MKLTLFFAWALLALGYWSLYYVVKGNTHLIPITLLAFGVSFLIALDYQVKKNKIKSENHEN